MPDTYAILREADCRLDLDKASEIMGPYLGLAKAEMLQALHNSPGILADHVEYDAARGMSKALILAGMPCRVVHDDHLIQVPAIPRVTIRGMEFTDEHLVFRSVEWEGHIPWEHIRLLDIVQEVEEKVEIVSVIEGNREGHSKKPERKARFEVSVFLEIVCCNPVLRMRIDRSLFRYKSTGLKMHTNREMNFRALCIALHMRSTDALIGPGFSWLSKGNNTHHQNGNTLKKFENFATWLLTVEAQRDMRRMMTTLAMLKRLHWATWTVLSVTLLALLLIMVPGEYQADGSILPRTDWDQMCYQLCIDARAKRQKAAKNDPESPGFYIDTHSAAFSHGWPRPYLVRALVYDYRRSKSKPWLGKKSSFASWGGSLHHNVSWSNYDNWPLSADGWLLRPWSLLLDVLVATVVLAAAGGLVQWRIQSNGALLRFKLADMLTIVTLIGIGLGTFLYHDTLRRREAFDGKPITAPAFRSPDGWITYGQSYQGPIWLRKLAGNPYYLSTLHHVDRATVKVDDRWRENFARLRDYPYLETLTTVHGLPIDAIPLLKDCPQLEEIHLGMYELDTPLLVPGTKDRTLQPDDFSLLEELRLKRVTVRGVFVQKKHIALLAALPTMRQIQIQSTIATQKQIAELRDEYPHVTFQELPQIPVFLSPG